MMKTFEEYEAETAWEARLENALRRARRQAAERRRKAIRRAVLLWASVVLVLAALWLMRETGKPEPEAPTVTAGRLAGDEIPAVEYASLVLWQELDPETAPPVQEDYENEKIEAALYASGYFREDVPLDGDLQSYLRVACDYMAELLSRYDVENALTAYNSGHPGHSAYARTVMGYWEELENG